MIQRGEMVGLFYSYDPDKCVYLGLAEYIGKETAPNGLAEAGNFDGRHVKLGPGHMAVGPGEQMSFRLLESGKVVYEQEIWYVPQAKVQRLLDGCERMHEGDIEDIRVVWQAQLEQEEELPLVASGFIEVHLSFSNLPLRDPSELPDDLSTEGDLCERIRLALNDLELADDEIDFKVREFEEFRRRPNRKRKDSERSGSMGVCPRWKED